jgi:hypothetical protein
VNISLASGKLSLLGIDGGVSGGGGGEFGAVGREIRLTMVPLVFAGSVGGGVCGREGILFGGGSGWWLLLWGRGVLTLVCEWSVLIHEVRI